MRLDQIFPLLPVLVCPACGPLEVMPSHPFPAQFETEGARVLTFEESASPCEVASWPFQGTAYPAAPLLHQFVATRVGVRPDESTTLGSSEVVRTLELVEQSHLLEWQGQGVLIAFGQQLPGTANNVYGERLDLQAAVETDCGVDLWDDAVFLPEGREMGSDRFSLGQIFGFGADEVCELMRGELPFGEGACRPRGPQYDDLFVWDAEHAPPGH